MRKGLFVLVCLVALMLTGMSFAVTAAFTPLAECNHKYSIVDKREGTIIVEENHQCTVCGARYNLYRDYTEIFYQCNLCREVIREVRSTPIYTDHKKCQAISRLLDSQDK